MNVLRDNLFLSIEHVDFNQLPDIDKTVIFMNNSPRQTAKYLVGAFKKRTAFLYTMNKLFY